MLIIRRRMRLWVAAWIVFQVASLSALVPRDCCAAHRPAAHSQEESCHEEAEAKAKVAAAHCPMPAANGAACPMHRETDKNKCALRGTCDGPTALLALLSQSGVLTDSFELLPDVHASSPAIPVRENLIGRLASPDPPPPRA